MKVGAFEFQVAHVTEEGVVRLLAEHSVHTIPLQRWAKCTIILPAERPEGMLFMLRRIRPESLKKGSSSKVLTYVILVCGRKYEGSIEVENQHGFGAMADRVGLNFPYTTVDLTQASLSEPASSSTTTKGVTEMSLQIKDADSGEQLAMFDLSPVSHLSNAATAMYVDDFQAPSDDVRAQSVPSTFAAADAEEDEYVKVAIKRKFMSTTSGTDLRRQHTKNLYDLEEQRDHVREKAGEFDKVRERDLQKAKQAYERALAKIEQQYVQNVEKNEERFEALCAAVEEEKRNIEWIKSVSNQLDPGSRTQPIEVVESDDDDDQSGEDDGSGTDDGRTSDEEQ